MKSTQFLKATPKEIHRRSAYVRMTNAVRSINKKTGCLQLRAVVTSRSRPSVKHTVIVECVSPKSKSLYNSDVRIYCDCEFFKYYGCSDVLPLYNAGFKKLATGIMPDERNPRRLPFVCLHCVRVINALMRNKK